MEGQRRAAFWALLGVVAIWGGTFSLVKDALADASPLLFNLLRFVLATGVLLAVNWRRLRGISRRTVLGGMVAGVLLAAGYELQTVGLGRTSAIHSAFLTGLVVVFVPMLSFVPRLRAPGAGAPGWAAIGGALLAFAGLFLITTPAGVRASELMGTVGVGDLLTLGCAVAFAAHLLALARLATLPAAQLTTLQIGFCAVAMLLCVPVLGRPMVHATARLAIAVAVTAVLATAAAFFIQTWAQQHLPATATALVLTLEPVFALGFAMVFLGERLSGRAAAGSGLILAGIAVTELLSSRSSTRPRTFEAA